jgi:signal peptidase I
MFPNVSSPEFDSWDPDNFGPITIPQMGMTVTLNRRNREVYRRVISVYEGHDLVEQGDLVTIDGEPASTYTFEQDYYWMMGDNRHHSADSRMWGFVPETHIVGRASFIWFSKMNQAQHGRSGVRTERIFSKVK